MAGVNCCRSTIWRPATADSFAGWTGAPATVHVSANVANPTFTINGPVEGIRFRMPDNGGPAIAGGDGIVRFTISTAETGVITPAGWAPAIPTFPAASLAGPFTKNQSGINMTLNGDGRQAQQDVGVWRLQRQNSTPPSPDYQWFTIEFDQPVTNVVINGSLFNGNAVSIAGNVAEGISQLQTFVEGPCNCCPMSPRPRCYSLEELQAPFDSVTIESNPNNIPTQNLALTIDQSLAGAPLKGVGPPFVNPVGLVLSYNFATPQTAVNRIQLYNNDGGILTDNDGIDTVTLDLIDSGGNVLRTVGFFGNSGANGAIPSTVSFPATNNVARIRMRNIVGLGNPANGPLWREFQAFRQVQQPTFAQVCFDGRRWFNPETGDEVDPDNILDCPDDAPVPGSPAELTNFRMNGLDFDFVAALPNDFLCNLLPAPSATTGLVLVGTCYEPSNASPTVTWNAPGNFIELEYGNNASTSSAVQVSFEHVGIGTYTWPGGNGFGMAIGEQRFSNILPGNNSRLRITYLAGPTGNDAPRATGLPNNQFITLHGAGTSAQTPIRFRLERIPV